MVELMRRGINVAATYHKPIREPITEHVRNIAHRVESLEVKIVLVLSRTARIVVIVDEGELSEGGIAGDVERIEDQDERRVNRVNRVSRGMSMSAIPEEMHGDAVQHEECAIRYASQNSTLKVRLLGEDDLARLVRREGHTEQAEV